MIRRLLELPFVLAFLAGSLLVAAGLMLICWLGERREGEG